MTRGLETTERPHGDRTPFRVTPPTDSTMCIRLFFSFFFFVLVQKTQGLRTLSTFHLGYVRLFAVEP